MIVKIHKTQDNRVLVAVCDSELLGKKFEEGNLQLDLASDFYKGEEKSEEELKQIINNAYIVNAVGEKSVGFCVKLGIVEEGNVLRVKGIPHAQAVIVKS